MSLSNLFLIFFLLEFFFYLQNFHSQCLQHFNLYSKIYLRYTYLNLYTTNTYTTSNTFTYNAFFLVFLH